jgi:rubredoxin
MNEEQIKVEWRKMSEAVIRGMSEWREQNAKATFREIEDEVDKRLSALRARMIADTAMQSTSTAWAEAAVGAVCPQCGVRLQKKGKKKRRFQTQEGQVIELEREYGVCPKCGHGLFPPR